MASFLELTVAWHDDNRGISQHKGKKKKQKRLWYKQESLLNLIMRTLKWRYWQSGEVCSLENTLGFQLG